MKFKANKFASAKVETIKVGTLELESLKVWDLPTSGLVKQDGIGDAILVIALDVVKLSTDFIVINIVRLKAEELANLLALLFLRRVLND